jgi:hypothetical protein
VAKEIAPPLPAVPWYEYEYEDKSESMREILPD